MKDRISFYGIYSLFDKMEIIVLKLKEIKAQMQFGNQRQDALQDQVSLMKEEILELKRTLDNLMLNNDDDKPESIKYSLT